MAKTKKSLKERLKEEKAKIKARSSGGNIIFLKEGTLRVRVLPVGEDADFVHEVEQYYLGNEIKGVFSPNTFGEPCAISEAYNELKSSDDPDDKDLAKKFTPKKKYLMPVLVYKDLKGKEVDEERSGRLVQLTSGLYEAIIDLYLDEDEWGDMTDPDEGYDLKLTRSGTGKTDTEYSVNPCKPSKLPKAWKKKGDFDLEKMVRDEIPTYEETQANIEEYLHLSPDDEDDKPKKKKKKKGSSKEKSSGTAKKKTTSRSKKKKSKRSSDI